MEKSSRPVRNRRHSRKIWLPGDNNNAHRPIKRLFTPEIKKMLKDWLVRRRENPYPSRDEKKTLAIETGLTYTQICNWFANWRRKLKNSGREPQKTTWGSLIKCYNDNARGNVEQFSISSNDSIWSDTEAQMASSVPRSAHPKIDLKKIRRKRQPKLQIQNVGGDYCKTTTFMGQMHLPVIAGVDGCHPENQFMRKFVGGPMIYDHFYKNCQRLSAHTMHNLPQPQCFQVSSTTDELNLYAENNISSVTVTEQNQPEYRNIGYFSNPSKYKNNIMEKYLRGLDENSPVKLTEMVPINMADPDNNNNSEKIYVTNNFSNGNGSQPAVPELSKWLVSAANFTPSKNNYIDWDIAKNNRQLDKKCSKDGSETNNTSPPCSIIGLSDTSLHQKEELDAAEALTRLANNCRNKFTPT